jgi:hypothetical protein
MADDLTPDASREQILRDAARAVEILDEPPAYPRPRVEVPSPYDQLATSANAIAVDGPLARRVYPVPAGMCDGHIHRLDAAGPGGATYDYTLATATTPAGLEFRYWAYLGPTLPGADLRDGHGAGAPPQPFTGHDVPHTVIAGGVEIACCSCADVYRAADPDSPRAPVTVHDWAVDHYSATGHHEFEHRRLDRYVFPKPSRWYRPER